jgi:hypothetical protein
VQAAADGSQRRTWPIYVVQQHIQLAAGWLRDNQGQQFAVAAALAAAVCQRAGNSLQDLQETTQGNEGQDTT